MSDASSDFKPASSPSECTNDWCPLRPDRISLPSNEDLQTGEIEERFFHKRSQEFRCKRCDVLHTRYRQSYTAHAAEQFKGEDPETLFHITIALRPQVCEDAALDNADTFTVLTESGGVWQRIRDALRYRNGRTSVRYLGCFCNKPTSGQAHMHAIVQMDVALDQVVDVLLKHGVGADSFIQRPEPGESTEEFGARFGAYIWKNLAYADSARRQHTSSKDGTGYWSEQSQAERQRHAAANSSVSEVSELAMAYATRPETSSRDVLAAPSRISSSAFRSNVLKSAMKDGGAAPSSPTREEADGDADSSDADNSEAQERERHESESPKGESRKSEGAASADRAAQSQTAQGQVAPRPGSTASGDDASPRATGSSSATTNPETSPEEDNGINAEKDAETDGRSRGELGIECEPLVVHSVQEGEDVIRNALKRRLGTQVIVEGRFDEPSVQGVLVAADDINHLRVRPLGGPDATGGPNATGGGAMWVEWRDLKGRFPKVRESWSSGAGPNGNASSGDSRGEDPARMRRNKELGGDALTRFNAMRRRAVVTVEHEDRTRRRWERDTETGRTADKELQARERYDNS